MTSPTSIIHFANVTKQFGDKRAVADASFKVVPGEIIGFVGPNGAGKTTTISMLLGFISSSHGTVTLFGDHEVEPRSAHKTHAKIGYCAGDMSMFDNLTGQQYLEFCSRQHGLHEDIQERLISKLDPQIHTKIKRLSRGNKQKIALIAALQHDPELIVLDEPTAGLDPLMQEVFIEIIREEAARGATVFMSSHILSEVAQVCSRVIFMKDGKITVDESMHEIEKNAGKIVTVSGSKKRELPAGGTLLEESSDSLTFNFKGDIGALIRWLQSGLIKDVTIEDRDLDDIFKDLYREETSA